jgi:xanthine/uracil permease
MAEHAQPHDSHGNSLAAWVAVGILLLAFLVMSIAVAVQSVTMFVLGAVGLVVGVVVGKLLAMAGYGVEGKRQPDAVVRQK